MKPFPILLFALAAGNATALAQTRQQTLEVTVENNWTSAKEDEPVVIRLADVNPGFEVQSATVFCGEKEIPSQLDDLNRDTEADELAFVADIPARSKQTFRVILSDQPSEKTYPARTHAQMRLSDKNQKCPHISYITFEGTVPVKQSYSAMYHHGPAFESELVAFRAYMDNRQSIDLYGKKYQRLELAETNFYLPLNIRLGSSFSCITRHGFLSDDMNHSELLWNANASWSFLKKKQASLKLEVYDILNRAKNITTYTTSTGSTQSRSEGVNSYCLLSFNYRFNLFKGKKEMED